MECTVIDFLLRKLASKAKLDADETECTLTRVVVDGTGELRQKLLMK